MGREQGQVMLYLFEGSCLGHPLDSLIEGGKTLDIKELSPFQPVALREYCRIHPLISVACLVVR